jgi:Ca2+-binding EF-hand superfamily protein
MRTTLLCVTCLACLAAAGRLPARAADANSVVPDASPQATQPAASQPAQAPDELTGAIDPYQPGPERAAFFTVAGVDNELDAKEFAAARKAAGGAEARPAGSFIRPFDDFNAMLAFDKNHNGTIDWFEAEAYRQDVRRRVLAAFDTNRDGWLTGRERSAANDMLSAGKLPGNSPVVAERVRIDEPTSAPADGQNAAALAEVKDRMARLRRQMFAKYDLNGDGHIDADEQKAMIDAVGKDAQAELDDLTARRFDADGDGRLDEREAAAMEKALAEREARDEKARHERDLRLFDANGDGKLDEKESAALAEANERRLADARQWRERADLQWFDLDGDGKLDEQEQLLADIEAVRRDVYAQAGNRADDGRQTWQTTVAQWRLRNFDADGDGKISPDEQAEVRKFEKRLGDIGQDFQRRMGDLDGDGQVSEEEQQAMRKEWQKSSWTIFAKSFRYMDTNGDGQISLAERDDFQRRMQQGAIGYIERFSASFDADHDGHLDAKEREDLLAGMAKQLEQRTANFDADHDGRLSPTEAINMMEDFVQQDLGLHPSAPATQPAK